MKYNFYILFFLLFGSFDQLKAQPMDDYSFYIGIGMNNYFKGITPIDIYTSDINRLYTPTKKYASTAYAPSIKLGYGSFDETVGFGFEFERSDTRISCKYNGYAFDSSVVEVSEKIKMINSKLKLHYTYFPTIGFMPNFLKNKIGIGASLDLGMIRNKRKQTGANYTDKWELFYTKTGLSKTRGYDLTVGLTLSLCLRINSHISLSYQRPFLLMDANFSGYAGKEVYMNSQYNQYGLIFYF
jgi:hypothetical protein